MAPRKVVILEDDLEGGEASETIGFAVDGSTYEIGLNENNAAHMRDVVVPPYIGAARRATGQVAGRPTRTSPRSPAGGKSASKAEDPKLVRAWAEANGVPVSSRGRVRADLLAKYRAAAGA